MVDKKNTIHFPKRLKKLKEYLTKEQLIRFASDSEGEARELPRSVLLNSRDNIPLSDRTDAESFIGDALITEEIGPEETQRIEQANIDFSKPEQDFFSREPTDDELARDISEVFLDMTHEERKKIYGTDPFAPPTGEYLAVGENTEESLLPFEVSTTQRAGELTTYNGDEPGNPAIVFPETSFDEVPGAGQIAIQGDESLVGTDTLEILAKDPIFKKLEIISFSRHKPSLKDKLFALGFKYSKLAASLLTLATVGTIAYLSNTSSFSMNKTEPEILSANEEYSPLLDEATNPEDLLGKIDFDSRSPSIEVPTVEEPAYSLPKNTTLNDYYESTGIFEKNRLDEIVIADDTPGVKSVELRTVQRAQLPIQEELTSYIVKEGDTLSEIATGISGKKLRAPESQIILDYMITQNSIENPNLIIPGQKLKTAFVVEIPVQKGDTLWNLCNGDKEMMDATSIANGIEDPNYLKAGQRIFLVYTKEKPAIESFKDGDSVAMTHLFNEFNEFYGIKQWEADRKIVQAEDLLDQDEKSLESYVKGIAALYQETGKTLERDINTYDARLEIGARMACNEDIVSQIHFWEIANFAGVDESNLREYTKEKCGKTYSEVKREYINQRAKEVKQAHAEGATTKQLAVDYGVSERTIKRDLTRAHLDKSFDNLISEESTILPFQIPFGAVIENNECVTIETSSKPKRKSYPVYLDTTESSLPLMINY